jgi:hypothetical protein
MDLNMDDTVNPEEGTVNTSDVKAITKSSRRGRKRVVRTQQQSHEYLIQQQEKKSVINQKGYIRRKGNKRQKINEPSTPIIGSNVSTPVSSDNNNFTTLSDTDPTPVGFHIEYDPPGNGNCGFAAVAQGSLPILELSELRLRVVQRVREWLNNPDLHARVIFVMETAIADDVNMQDEKLRLQQTITNENELISTSYLNCMSEELTWAEQLSLIAMSAVVQRILIIYRVLLNEDGTVNATSRIQRLHPRYFGISVTNWQPIYLLLTHLVDRPAQGH